MVDFPIRLIFLVLFSCFLYPFSYGQLIDNSRVHPYQKVFVETDNFGDSYLEHLAQGVDTIENDSVQFSILNDLAYYWHTRNLNTALDFTRKGLQLTKAKENVLWEGRFQMTQGAILLRMEKLDSAQTVLELAKTKVLQSDLAFLNTQLGYVYERKGQLDKAADYAMTALNLGEKLNDTKAKAMAYSDLSILFWKQSKYTSGLEYALKSLAFFNSWGITDLDYGFTLYVAGNNYLALKDYENALDYYKKSIVVGERYGFYNNLSDVYISLVDLYTFLGEFDNAEEAGENAVKYAELLENNFMVMRSWLSVGKMHNAKSNYKEAVNALERCITVATDDFGDAYYLSLAYKELGMAYAGINQYKKAYEAFSHYDTLNDEVFTAEADHRISELRTEFDVAQKESTIMVQESLIKKQETRQKLGLVITILLVLLLLLAYKAISSNSKKNRLLQKQNDEKEFLLKEIHHRVKNNLEIVSSLLSLQAAQLDDPNIVEAMQKSQQRVQSMSMIHQKLYQGKSLAAVEMKDYFINLGNYIIDSYGAKGRIRVICLMEELELDIDFAIPIGLIVNELLTNSMKYAFTKNGIGEIIITLVEFESTLRLKVADNGVGRLLDVGNDGLGFGTQLIELLTKQLDGKMNLTVQDGTSVYFEFQIKKAA